MLQALQRLPGVILQCCQHVLKCLADEAFASCMWNAAGLQRLHSAAFGAHPCKQNAMQRFAAIPNASWRLLTFLQALVEPQMSRVYLTWFLLRALPLRG
jgi:hypothetical protein